MDKNNIIYRAPFTPSEPVLLGALYGGGGLRILIWRGKWSKNPRMERHISGGGAQLM